MKRVSIIILFGAVFLLCCPRAYAGDVDTASRYDNLTRGWWWYEDPPKAEDKKKDKEEQKPKRVLPQLKDYTAEQLWNMHPDDFQPLALSFLKKGVQSGKLEDVREFYVMVDIARAKSHVFQNVAAAAWQKYPELSLDVDIPTNALGRITKTQMTEREVEEKISASADKFALVYFYQINCDYCKAQDEVIAGFVNKYQMNYGVTWEVKRVELNEHPELAARFDVKITPYLMLIYRDSKDFFPVSIGVSARQDIEDKLYRGIRLLDGEITPESYTMYDFQRGGRLDPAGYMSSESANQNKEGNHVQIDSAASK